MEPHPPLPKSAIRAVIAFLNASFAEYGIRASTIVPNPRPEHFFKVTLDGLTWAPEDESEIAAHTDALVNVEYWETNPDAAESLGRLVFAKLADFNTDDFWCVGFTAGLAYLEDELAEVPRYVCTPIIRSRIENC